MTGRRQAGGAINARFLLRYPAFTLDVDLVLPGRGVTALFGPSGSGKTTLLRCIAGLERPLLGRLSIDGDAWQDGPRFLPTHRRPLGYVFQDASLFPHLSAGRNVEFGRRRAREPLDAAAVAHVVDLLGIGHLLDRRPDQLSGGERQRVAIARALAVKPRLLLMDEPLVALDLKRKQEILPYLERLHGELAIPILYVTHSPDEVARLADHIVLLDAGRVHASGPIAELRARLDLAIGTGSEADAIVDCRVAGHDDRFHLSYLEFPGGQVSVPRHDLPIGHAVRLRVLARDVSLTLAPQTGTSILNIFPAVVEELAEESAAQLLVRLNVAGTPLLARITRKSASLLDLVPGKTVYAQVKAVALLA